jgi:hypothetical protein
MKNKYYIYAILPGRKFASYWNGTGWTDRRNDGRFYPTEAEAERPLRQMMLDNIKAKVGDVMSLRA